MDRARRLEYLRAMGVEAWERRDLPPPPPPPIAQESRSAESIASSARPVASLESSTSMPAQSSMPSIGASPASGARLRGAAAETLARIPVISPGRAAGTTVPPETEAQWEGVRAEVLSCNKCSLHTTRTQGVFGVGNRRAEWLIIGEAPGAEEDRRGEPFVGRAGQLLNAMLAAIGLPREQVFIANVLKSRPPGNRDPKPDEVAACLPYLMRQIALLQPRLMLAVGRIAAQNLLATDVPLGRLRGQLHTFGELNTPLIVTYHPAYLLRTPADKRKAWEDLKFARSTFQRLASQEQ